MSLFTWPCGAAKLYSVTISGTKKDKLTAEKFEIVQKIHQIMCAVAKFTPKNNDTNAGNINGKIL